MGQKPITGPWPRARSVAWDYTPVGPYFASFGATSVLSGQGWGDYDESLTHIVHEWVLHALPPADGGVAAILDCLGAIVVGYFESDGDRGWMGCAAGWDVLGRHAMVRPEQAAAWEAWAKLSSEHH